MATEDLPRCNEDEHFWPSHAPSEGPPVGAPCKCGEKAWTSASPASETRNHVGEGLDTSPEAVRKAINHNPRFTPNDRAAALAMVDRLVAAAAVPASDAPAPPREWQCPDGVAHLYEIVVDEYCVEAIKRLTANPSGNQPASARQASEYAMRDGSRMTVTPTPGELLSVECVKCRRKAVVGLAWQAINGSPDDSYDANPALTATRVATAAASPAQEATPPREEEQTMEQGPANHANGTPTTVGKGPQGRLREASPLPDLAVAYLAGAKDERGHFGAFHCGRTDNAIEQSARNYVALSAAPAREASSAPGEPTPTVRCEKHDEATLLRVAANYVRQAMGQMRHRRSRHRAADAQHLLESLAVELPDLRATVAALTAERATPEALAQQFHEAYERLAPSFGYATREASAKPWADVPEDNRRLMTAVCAEILASRLRAGA